MKSLFETIFAILFIGFIVVNLPAIIGFIFLCLIVKSVYSIVTGNSSEEEKTQPYNQTGTAEMHNTKSEYQQKREVQKTESVTTKSTGTYSGYSYSHSRYRNDDDYDNSYYDDWQDDYQPEEGDGFRGTGAPFL